MEPELVTTHDHGGPVRASQHTQLVLGMVMTILVAATAVGAVLLWPHNVPAKQPWLDPGASLVIGSVAQIVPDDGQTGHLVLRLDDGSSVEVPGDPSAPLSEVRLGQRVLAMTLPGQPGAYFIDYERGAPMLALAALFVGLVIAVARWKGVAALVGLATALAIVWTFTLPALSIARNPLGVALVTASLVMFVVVYLAHGISVKTTTALIGTFLGIAVVAGLAWWAIPAASLTPLQDEVMGQLPSQFPGIDARGILLCGMVLAGVGVLNDVTITQASAVWELREAAPTASRRTIFGSAMRIGRDHIASTVYTIAFAYVGTALALLLLASRLNFTILQLLTFNTVAQEVIATLVASIALVAAIPLTTALAAWLAGPTEAGHRSSSRPISPRRAEPKAEAPSGQLSRAQVASRHPRGRSPDRVCRRVLSSWPRPLGCEHPYPLGGRRGAVRSPQECVAPAQAAAVVA